MPKGPEYDSPGMTRWMKGDKGPKAKDTHDRRAERDWDEKGRYSPMSAMDATDKVKVAADKDVKAGRVTDKPKVVKKDQSRFQCRRRQL